MKKVVLIFCGFILLSTCTKEHITSREYPRVETSDVTNITSTGAQLQGAITYTSTQVIDHGFIWSTTPMPTFENSDKVSLGSKSGTGLFSATIDRSLIVNVKYFARAYAQSNKYIVYGNVVSFVSLGSFAPVISDFDPKLASWGDTITVTGKNFSNLVSGNAVKFDTITAKVIQAAEFTLKVIVPDDLIKSESKLSVGIAGNISTAAPSFLLSPALINSFTPDSANVGETITINGVYFNLKHTVVMFGNKLSTGVAVNGNRSSLICHIPAGLSRGNTKISLSIGDQTTIAGKDFFRASPIINSITPAQANFNDPLLINGRFFGPEVGLNQVVFNGNLATVVSASSTTIQVKVPTYLPYYQPTVAVVVGSDSAKSNLFSLLPPVIESIIPATGLGPGSSVRIIGQNFGSNPNLGGPAISINGVLTYAQAVGNDLQFDLPNSYFTNHQLSVSVNISGQSAAAPIVATTSFIRLSDFPNPVIRNWSSEFAINNKVYYGLGFVGFGATPVFSDFWEYDPALNNWTQLADFPGGNRSNATSFVLGDKAYVGGGITNLSNQSNLNQNLHDLWQFDPGGKTWVKKNDMPVANEIVATYSVNSKEYVVMGSFLAATKQLWEYDPSLDQWTRKADFIGTIGSPVVGPYYYFVDNGLCYIGAGESFDGLWSFDPVLNIWTEAPFKLRLDQASGFNVNGVSYVVNYNNEQMDYYQFDPNAQSLILKYSYYFYSFSSGNKVYVSTIGGKTYIFAGSNQFLEFDPNY